MKPAALPLLSLALLAVPAHAAVVADPLTVAGVFLDASVEVKLALVGLIAAIVASVVVWALELAAIRKGRLEKTPARLAFLGAVSGAAPLLGLATSAYVLLNIALGVSNVRPTPSAAVVAPGVAEALTAVTLALLAAGVATALRRHLEGRMAMWRGAGQALAPAE